MFYNIIKKTKFLNYGRDIIANEVASYAVRSKKNFLKMLDLGAGGGSDLLNCKQVLIRLGIGTELFAIEKYAPNVIKLRESCIETSMTNIEEEIFPYGDGQFDIVIMNQCLEHTKEVFHIFGEISRVLKKGGICIVGVPNLASFHNRIMLLFGRQPSSIRMFGPHIRGITRKDFINFVEVDKSSIEADLRGGGGILSA